MDVLAFLFLKEAWNEFFEQIAVESERLGKEHIQAVLGCEAVKSIYDSDERLRRFWGTFVNPEIPIHTLQAARLL